LLPSVPASNTAVMKELDLVAALARVTRCWPLPRWVLKPQQILLSYHRCNVHTQTLGTIRIDVLKLQLLSTTPQLYASSLILTVKPLPQCSSIADSTPSAKRDDRKPLKNDQNRKQLCRNKIKTGSFDTDCCKTYPKFISCPVYTRQERIR